MTTEAKIETITKKKTRTITLTGRPPVSIDEAEWQRIAHAKTWDGEHEVQANRKWQITVRENGGEEPGTRMIVYGVYATRWQGEHGHNAGEIVESTDSAQVCRAIERVAEAIGCPELAHDCIAGLPAEEV